MEFNFFGKRIIIEDNNIPPKRGSVMALGDNYAAVEAEIRSYIMDKAITNKLVDNERFINYAVKKIFEVFVYFYPLVKKENLVEKDWYYFPYGSDEEVQKNVELQKEFFALKYGRKFKPFYKLSFDYFYLVQKRYDPFASFAKRMLKGFLDFFHFLCIMPIGFFISVFDDEKRFRALMGEMSLRELFKDLFPKLEILYSNDRLELVLQEPTKKKSTQKI